VSRLADFGQNGVSVTQFDAPTDENAFQNDDFVAAGLAGVAQSERMKDRPRAAFTIEQCWHRVPGGTAVAGLGMARALAGRGDVDVVGVAARHRHPAPAPWTPPIEVAHLPLPRIALYEAWHYLRTPKVQLATGPVDVVHATANAMPPKSAPIVLTAHDLAWRREPGHYTKRGVRFFERGLALALRDADLVLCPSEATLLDCKEAGFPGERLRLVPLGVEAHPATPADVQRIRTAFGLTRPYVLWVGTIEPRKNLAGLLEAWRAIDGDVELALAGPTGWNEDLSALVARLGVEVRALGFVPADDLGPLYAGAEALCFPSLWEGFGFPVLEAMAQGTPVVTSAGTSTAELAVDAGVLVDPRDPASIARGLESVLSSRELAGSLASRGRQRAAEFTWKRTGELIVDAYKEVIAP
jgi:glycosyltransferase involved in cell wall biosynthesis